MLLSTHRNLQASWESIGTEGHESSSGERAARMQVISSLAQMAPTDEHANAVAAVPESMARMTGQVLSSAHKWTLHTYIQAGAALTTLATCAGVHIHG